MKTSFLAPLLFSAAICLVPAQAEPAAPPAPAPAKPASPLEQAKTIAAGIHKAMDNMISAVEKTKDEKTAQIAADAIMASTEQIQELATQGRELQEKLSDADKAAIEKSMDQMKMGQYNERIGKAFMALADKPELMGILQPAIASFTAAAMKMAAEESGQQNGDVIRGRDKGVPRRLLDNGGRVGEPKNRLVE